MRLQTDDILIELRRRLEAEKSPRKKHFLKQAIENIGKL